MEDATQTDTYACGKQRAVDDVASGPEDTTMETSYLYGRKPDSPVLQSKTFCSNTSPVIVLTDKTKLVRLTENVTGESYAAMLQIDLLPFVTQTSGDVVIWIMHDHKAPSLRVAVVTQL